MTKEKKFVKKGLIVKISGQNSIKVEVKNMVYNKILRKRYYRNQYFLVHDPFNQSKVGDEIIIAQGRKVSKNKTWHIITK